MSKIICIISLFIITVLSLGQSMFYIGPNCEIDSVAGVCNSEDDCWNSIPLFLRNQPTYLNESYLCTIPIANKCNTPTKPAKVNYLHYYYTKPVIYEGKNFCYVSPGAGECYDPKECNQFVVDMYTTAEPKQFVCVQIPPSQEYSNRLNAAKSPEEFKMLVNKLIY